MYEERILVTWMVDSGGVHSAHVNRPGLTAAQSYLGRLALVPVEGEKKWGYYWHACPDTFQPCASFSRALKELHERSEAFVLQQIAAEEAAKKESEKTPS